MSPTIILIIVLALGIPATYGATSVYYEQVLSGTVRAERNAAVERCDLRISDLGLKSREEAARRAAEGDEAAAGVSHTPEERSALVALCERSASCRDRGKQ